MECSVVRNAMGPLVADGTKPMVDVATTANSKYPTRKQESVGFMMMMMMIPKKICRCSEDLMILCNVNVVAAAVIARRDPNS